MRFTARTIYAFHALVELARASRRGDSVVTLNELSKTCEIPLKFLVAVLANLRRADIVESLRGKEGGYRLAVPAETLRLGSVVRATEPSRNSPARRGPSDHLAAPERTFLENIRRKAEAGAFTILDSLTLQDALEAITDGTGEMYYI